MDTARQNLIRLVAKLLVDDSMAHPNATDATQRKAGACRDQNVHSPSSEEQPHRRT
jgi:hypothetical protein